MLTIRTVSLLNGQADLAPVLSHQQIQQQNGAQDLLQQARFQAEQIIRQAEEEAAQIRQQTAAAASEKFWQQAELFFAQWQQQQHMMIESLDQVVNAALQQLLTELPESARTQALLYQLLKASNPTVAGRLRCHPQLETDVSQWLQQHPAINWKIIADDSLLADTIQLSTDQGDLLLNWTQATSALINL